MRNQFRGYYPPDEKELNKLWEEGLIILDTNALLNLFRYTPTTKDDFVGVLELVKDQLWIPHQVGLEFHRNRLQVIDQQQRAFDEVDEALGSAKANVLKALQKFQRHPSLNVSAITEALEHRIAEIVGTVAASRNEHSTSVVEADENGKTFDQIADLFEGKVGEKYTQEALEKIYTEGAVRYAAEIPPGFEDKKKPEPDRYGDLILWKQILDQGARAPRPAIFVTDDAKEDWWLRVSGKTQGARVELIDEYHSASGSRIHFYSPEKFLAFALKRSNTEINQEFLDEVEEVSSERQRTNLRAEEQLLIRRNQLRHDKDRLLRQLGHWTSDRHGTYAANENRVSKNREAIGRLHWEIAEISGEIENLTAAFDSGEFTGAEADHLAFRLGRLKAARSAAQERIVDLNEQNEKYFSSTRQAEDPEAIDHIHGSVETIEAQLEEVELALEELSE